MSSSAKTGGSAAATATATAATTTTTTAAAAAPVANVAGQSINIVPSECSMSEVEELDDFSADYFAPFVTRFLETFKSYHCSIIPGRIMRDPVMIEGIEDDRSYEKKSLEQWVERCRKEGT